MITSKVITSPLWWKDYGTIPDGWSTILVGEAFQFLRTNSLPRNDLSDTPNDSSTYNIHYGDIHATFSEPILDLSTNQQVPVLNANVTVTNSDVLTDGDLIVADASEDYEGVGQSVELKNVGTKKVVAGLHTFALRDRHDYTEAGFRALIFRHPKVANAIKVIATGSKVYGVSKTNLAELSIILPSRKEQKKIATILGTWDKAIAKQEKLIAEKEDLKKGLMQQLLTGKKRFPGFMDEWQWVRLNQVSKIQGRVGWKGYKTTDLRKSGPLVIGASHIDKQNKLDLSEPVHLSREKYEESPEIMISSGDVIIVQRGSLGKVVLIDEPIGEATINPSMAILRVTGAITPEFLYYQLCSESVQRIIRTESNSTGVPMISQKQIGTFKLHFPSEDEQNKIVSTLSVADNEIEQLNTQLTMLNDQKKGLMQQLLTGKVRVKIEEE